jgi:hypothetical protein
MCKCALALRELLQMEGGGCQGKLDDANWNSDGAKLLGLEKVASKSPASLSRESYNPPEGGERKVGDCTGPAVQSSPACCIPAVSLD